MKDSEVLRRARKLIEDRKADYLCYAIDDCVGGTLDQKQSLTKWVMKMLYGAIFYPTWVKQHHPEIYVTMRAYEFRQGRLAWLDWMIEECEKAEAAIGVIPVKPTPADGASARVTH